MAGVRNLTQAEAIERARLLDVSRYDIILDLTDGAGKAGDHTFRSTTEISFRCTEPGASTFIELGAERIRSVTLNGVPVDVSNWTAETGLTLTGLDAVNTLVVDGDFPYSSTGQGLHRSVDPVDDEVYLYSQFETADAQRAFACFDQPDLKSVFTWHVTAPAHWKIISNAQVASTDPGTVEGTTVTHFAESVTMSTYITALCAGPYHEVRDQHDGIDLGVFCRTSVAQHLDADDILLVTKQGFDFFHEQFGIRYPLPKYDQLLVPDFNAGAMENFGCVTHSETYYLFRSQVTDYEYESRANTILHEMAHMWFGDLVTMRWWDDLWLNESFAEWASHWCNASATRFTDAWTTFLAVRKNWGYRQDQLSSTHPVYCDIPDVEAVEVNFDGITYAKGASVIKQLVAYVGLEPFVAGLRSYFQAHAWGNATFDDLLSALEVASGKKLRDFSRQWLETAQVNTLRPIVEIGADGRYSSVAVAQEAPEAYPTLRTHRIGIGLYDQVDGRLVRRELHEIDVSAARTEVPALVGVPAADVLLLNDEDLSYLKLRLDERSMAHVVSGINGFEESLPRALCWTAAWDMVRDAELAARDFVALLANGLPGERDINVITAISRQAPGSLAYYADPAWAPTGWAVLASTALATLRAVEPGSGRQLSWARVFISAARSADELGVLRDWLAGVNVPAGLAIDTDLRWSVLHALVANGAADPAAIDAELDRDRTGSGQRQAAAARALVPTSESKERAWSQLTGSEAPSNWLARSLLEGFSHPAQLSLTEPYIARYFAVLGQVWATRDSESAQEFVESAFPVFHVTPATVAAANAWLAESGHPAPLRRLVAEGRDAVVRSLRARDRDVAAGAAR